MILIADSFGSRLPESLSTYAEVTTDPARLGDAEILLVRSRTRVTRETIDAAPNLKLVVRGGVGLDTIDVAHAESKGIRVVNTPEASTIAVVELTFALMLALPNHLPEADRSMREGKWLKSQLRRTELWGKTLGIIGMGRIGTGVAVRAKAFGMHVLAWHPRRQFTEFAELVPTLPKLLSASQYVSLNLPLTEETRGIINAETLAHVRDGAYLINTGRGKCVVEEDVVAALESGKLAGFGNDVWAQDPPVASPLIEAPNCILTPHLGASSEENMDRIGEIVERMVAEYYACE